MALYLGVLLFSFIITSISIVPFIDLLYKLHLIHRPRPPQKHPPAIFLDPSKIGTPVGGGVLLIFTITLLFFLLFPLVSRFGVFISSSFPLREELNVIFFTLVSFGILGLYEDLVKIFHLPYSHGYKNHLQLVLALVVSYLLFKNLNIEFLNIPLFGVLRLGWWYLPFSILVIFTFARGFDISDGLDGLSCGLLLIALLAFWVISVSQIDTLLSIFIALWIGSLLAFLYFNVYPARIWLGNSGSLSFGATLAVTGLLLGKPVALFLIGLPFIAEALSNFLQTVWLAFFRRPLFSVAPLHYWFLHRGWPEPKVVLRFWLVAQIVALVGLWFAGL